MSFWSTVQKDEAWVIAEIQKGWAELQAVEQTAVTDVEGIFSFIAAHATSIESALKTALGVLSVAGALDPALAPAVVTATAAIDASTAAIDALSKGITAGSTPLSTVVQAYQLTKDAVAAATPVLKAASAQPKKPVAAHPAKKVAATK